MRKYNLSLVDYNAEIVKIGAATFVPLQQKSPIAYDQKGRKLGKVCGHWPMIVYNRYGGNFINFPYNTPQLIRQTVSEINLLLGRNASLDDFVV